MSISHTNTSECHLSGRKFSHELCHQKSSHYMHSREFKYFNWVKRGIKSVSLMLPALFDFIDWERVQFDSLSDIFRRMVNFFDSHPLNINKHHHESININLDSTHHFARTLKATLKWRIFFFSAALLVFVHVRSFPGALFLSFSAFVPRGKSMKKHLSFVYVFHFALKINDEVRASKFVVIKKAMTVAS